MAEHRTSTAPPREQLDRKRPSSIPRNREIAGIRNLDSRGGSGGGDEGGGAWAGDGSGGLSRGSSSGYPEAGPVEVPGGERSREAVFWFIAPRVREKGRRRRPERRSRR